MVRYKFFKVRWPRKNANLKNFRHLKLWQSTYLISRYVNTNETMLSKIRTKPRCQVKSCISDSFKNDGQENNHKKKITKERGLAWIQSTALRFLTTFFGKQFIEIWTRNLQKESAAEDITCWVMQTLNCFHSQSLRGGKFALCENIVKKT